MDVECGVICHLQCEISSVSVTGLGCAGGDLFLRCHVPAGGGRAIQIDSRGADQPDGGEMTTPPGAAAAVSWCDVASLSCDGSPARVRELVDRGAVVFEVRRRRGGTRRRAPLLGSELVGRAEVPWRDAYGESGGDAAVAVELAAPSSRRRVLGREAPAILLSARMSVRVSETAVPAERRRRAGAGSSAAEHPHRRQIGCEWSVGDEDVFAAVACAADDAFE
ncbi:unnamed protein product [Urochloa humidicola]